jgi:hypothetical protein
MYKRNVPECNLEPYYTPRAYSTKYSRFPVVFHEKTKTKITSSVYNPTRDFAPTTTTPPFNGYSDNITIENTLRNQYYALQKSNQAVYIPSSTSDLYNVTAVGRECVQTHPLLFHTDQFEPSVAATQHATANGKIGGGVWCNHTRNQLRNMS